MTIALWLMALQGVIGAFDTMYYHEWRARLPARGRHAASELKLHAGRDYLYAVIFGTLPWIAWQGLWVLALVAVLVAEIILTLSDFVAEIAVREVLGDVYAGERVDRIETIIEQRYSIRDCVTQGLPTQPGSRRIIGKKTRPTVRSNAGR